MRCDRVDKPDPTGGGSPAAAGPRLCPGRQEHAQPARTDPRRGRRGQPLQENRRLLRKDRAELRGRVPRAASDAARGDHPRPERHRRTAARATTRPLLQGDYGHYCYLPLYVFCGNHLLCSKLRPPNIDACAGTVAELRRVISQIREACPAVRIAIGVGIRPFLCARAITILTRFTFVYRPWTASSACGHRCHWRTPAGPARSRRPTGRSGGGPPPAARSGSSFNLSREQCRGALSCVSTPNLVY